MPCKIGGHIFFLKKKLACKARLFSRVLLLLRVGRFARQDGIMAAVIVGIRVRSVPVMVVVAGVTPRALAAPLGGVILGEGARRGAGARGALAAVLLLTAAIRPRAAEAEVRVKLEDAQETSARGRWRGRARP